MNISWRKMTTDTRRWSLSRQARQDLNPQPAVLETAALPIELLAYNTEATEAASAVSIYLTNPRNY
jgi:hypothetical protein